MLFDVSLMGMANPDLTPDTVKALWYFLWLQELLLHFPPVVAICFLLLAFAAFLILVPFSGQQGGRPLPLLQILFVGFFVVIIGLTVTGLWFRGAGMKLIWPW